MTEIFEFIEQLKNIKKLVLASPERFTNIHVIKYIDILINLQQEKIDRYEKDMLEEYNAKMYASGTRSIKSKHQKK
tara:strand:- start:1364 stop:1591 length:228 start_codon:yes stop_codon:yes gene_type:complete